MSDTYWVLGCKPWNKKIFEQELKHLEGQWKYISNKNELSLEILQDNPPKYLFFLHWSWWVPEDILENYTCVCFHMTDVPYGRGGSPLQNLISRGHKTTMLTALKMVKAYDAGPVYLKKELSLHGNAEEILIRAGQLSSKMIQEIINGNIIPQEQTGEVVYFTRRTPEQSKVPDLKTLEALYDFVRMLDGEGYPPAFLEHSGYRFEFTRANLYHSKLEARVSITRIQE